MTIQTRITKMLGIEHPIVMGGMTGVGTPELAAAVSNAGGLGIMAIHNAGTPENGRLWIRQLKSLLRDPEKTPFGVNLTILPTMGPETPPYEAYANVMIEENVKIVETAGSSPKKWLTLFAQHNIVTIHKCVTIRHALSAQKYGVDIVSLDGFECAGHPGEDDIGNFVLQAKGADTLSVPYLCSGGVGNGKQIAAALALGADGVNCGTRFCATIECNWPDSFKQRMLAAQETDTVMMLRRLNNTCRVFRNEVATTVEEIEANKGNDFSFTDVAHLVNGKRGRKAEQDNNADGGIWSAGQVVGLITSIPSCQQLITEMMTEAEEVIVSRLQSLVINNNNNHHHNQRQSITSRL